MGVFPCCGKFTPVTKRLPHARGGVSHIRTLRHTGKTSSPRPWGCFHLLVATAAMRMVFPTPVGVFLAELGFTFYPSSLPPARGGVSICFTIVSHVEAVFPTPVGVFPTCFWRSLPPKSLPHARGGVSSYSPVASLLRKSSPRPWGCFLVILKSLRLILVFPTPVGVFLRANRPWQCREGLPHARGGVSFKWSAASRSCASSPRPWGCFSPVQMDYKKHRVFPTPVGVFPDVQAQLASIGGLPHARGGVSSCKSVGFQPNTSSPRTWGCFSLLILKRTKNLVFPTPDIGKSALRLPISGKSFCQTTLFF